MKRKLLSTIILTLLFFPVLNGQDLTEEKIERAKLVYRNLEYNTITFRDLQKKWTITDPIYVREIFNRFLTRNALKINGEKPTLEQIKEHMEHIYKGYVFLDLRQRYYDQELESIRFFTERNYSGLDTTDFFFDPIKDYIYIKDILGDPIYEDLKSRFYSSNDITKTYFDNKELYQYDIYIHAFEPRIMFLPITTEARNKFLGTAFAKWGSDMLMWPGWYYPSIFVGAKLTYIDYIINNRPNTTYEFSVGTGQSVRQPYLELFSDQTGQRIYQSASTLYFKLFADPIRVFFKDEPRIEVTLEASLGLFDNDVQDFPLSYNTLFYSNKTFYGLYLRKKRLFEIPNIGFFGMGAGHYSYDIYQYLLDQNFQELIELDHQFKNMAIGELRVWNEAGFLDYDTRIQFNYDYIDQLGYIGFIFELMFSNMFGIEFKYFSTLMEPPTGVIPYYRLDNYITFSPMIRINY